MAAFPDFRCTTLHTPDAARDVSGGVALADEPRAARERLEEELRCALQARSVRLRDDSAQAVAPPPDAVCFDVPASPGDGHARLEVIFDKPRSLDDWTCQLIEAATQLSSMVLELERAIGRGKFGSSLNRSIDGAAPLIGASEAIRRVRERIERVAATDFTVLIEGESGPQPHPNFIGVLGEAPFGRADREVAGAWEDGSEVTVWPIRAEARIPLATVGSRRCPCSIHPDRRVFIDTRRRSRRSVQHPLIISAVCCGVDSWHSAWRVPRSPPKSARAEWARSIAPETHL